MPITKTALSILLLSNLISQKVFRVEILNSNFSGEEIAAEREVGSLD
jgi:hypothetical protein